MGRYTPELASASNGRRDTDGVVEGQTEGLVDFLAALAAIEQILLDVVTDGEQSAARRVGRRVHAVRASYTAGKGA